jgi:photosystem II stability/assembly factor-like uncharacterized protein
MKTPARWIVLAAAVMLPMTNGQAEWTRLCQPGADVFSLAVSGENLLGVGSKSRILFTTDSGDSWTDTTLTRFDYPLLYKISVFEEVSMVGQAGCGIFYMSRDGSWKSSTITGTDDILAFAESRGNSTITFLAAGFGGGVRISSDSGKSWISSNSGLTNLNVTSLASGPTVPDLSGQTVFAGTYGGGVFASTDNGQNWTSKNERLTALQINAMQVAGDRLYVAGSGGRVCVSFDWGESWWDMVAGLPNTELLSITIAQDALREWIYVGSIDAGVWRCPTTGGVWSPMNTGLENMRVNSIMANAGALFIGTHEGVYRSRDGGAVWSRVTDGASPQLDALHAVRLSSSTDLLVCGTTPCYEKAGMWRPPASSLFATENSGTSWRTTDALFVGAIPSLTHFGNLVFLASTGDLDAGGGGMYVSRDFGGTWTYPTGTLAHHIPGPSSTFCSLEIIPRNGGNSFECYLGMAWGGIPGVFISSDTGSSWIHMGGTYVTSLCAMDEFLVVRGRTGAVTRTTDKGATWVDITSHLSGNNVISFTRDEDRMIASISYDPANSRPGGLLMTTDAGETWLPAGLEGRTVTSLLSADNYLLAVADGKVYACAPEALEWVDVTGNLSGTGMGKLTATSEFCYVLGADQKSIWMRPMAEIREVVAISVPVQLARFAGTLQNGIVRLEWSTLSEVNNYGFFVQRRLRSESSWIELPGSFIAGHGTTIEPQHYSFTDAMVRDSSGSYRLKQVDLDGSRHFSEPIQVTVVTSVQEHHPLTFSLCQNYPNPFNPTTIISYQLPVASDVRLIVHDVLGREVAVLVNERRDAGVHEIKFDGSHLASGVYFYRMKAGAYVETKRLQLLR